MADEPQTGGMIALIPDVPGKLTVSGGDPTSEIHLTLTFLGDNVSEWDDRIKDAIRALGARLAADFGPLEVRIMGHATWNMDGGPDGSMEPCAVYEIADDPLLSELHEMACEGARRGMGEALWPNQHPVYKPHITAGYNIDSSLLKATGTVRLTTVRVEIGPDTIDYPLTGTRDQAGQPVAAYSEGTEAMAETTVDQAKVGKAEVTKDGDELALHWPCLVLEGMRTGDGRFIPYGSLGARGLPLSVLGQVTNDDGHRGAEVFGKITKLERHDGPSVISKETGEPFPEGTAVWEAWGVGDADSKPGKLALAGYLTGNSVDIADATVEDELADGKPQRTLVGGKIGATTLVPLPAFADGYVEVNGKVVDAQPAIEPVTASAAWTLMDDADTTPLVASAAGELPPLGWFTDPKLPCITPLQRDGRHVWGHIADWKRPHIGFDGRHVFAERSRADYKWFRTGAYPAIDTDGQQRTVGVGRLTIGGGHAPLHMNHQDAKRFYFADANAQASDAATAWAYVAAGEDEHGIWVNGVTSDGADEVTIRRALAHPPSVDQRPIDGHLELVAAHSVNTAGIPIPRARVASGEVVALVAAGYVPPAPDNPDVLAELVAERVLAGLVNHLAPTPDPALEQRRDTAVLSLRMSELTEELGMDVSIGDGWPIDQADVDYLDSLSVGELRTLHIPPYMSRIEKHLRAKGMSESHAIAVAKNAAKRMCETGDLNFPGLQQVNAGSRAEACAALAQWRKDRPGAT